MAVYSVSSRKQTPQSKPIPGSNQVKNSAGGFSFALDDWGRLRRFLILGAEGGTYYIGEKDLLKGNHAAVTRCLKADGRKTVEMIVEVSDKGLAYRNEAALYALALATASDDQETRKLALEALPKVARIGTHLFHWAHYVNSMRGWGRGLRNAVSKWYTEKTVDQLAMQAVKYQQRDGWSHSDLLRLAHPSTDDEVRDSVFRWMIGGKDALGDRKVSRKLPKVADSRVSEYPSRLASLPALIQAFEEAKTADEKTVIKLITERGLPREAIPTQHLNSVAVWDSLLTNMPATAMIRNLGKMTSVGLIKPLSKASMSVVQKLKDTEWLKKSRVHPMQFLIAARVYSQGRGEKGKLTWSPDQSVVSALETAFYASFGNVTPVGKPMLFSMDVSGSMSSPMAGTCLSCAEAETALALVHLGIEDQVTVMGFATDYRELKLRKGMSLVDAVRRVSNLNFGGTDCSLPFTWAKRNKMDVGAFIVTTDNETWAGNIHPSQALNAYRQSSGNAARSVVVGMTATEFTIADPNDGGSLDVVGFDASTPSLIADFCRGDI
jgi:60 kDa SS-A/Ro ribonucleoprotein